MKKFLAVLMVVSLILSLAACKKEVDRAEYDEGEKMDADASSMYAEENQGNPYAQSEIGHHRAYKNLIIAIGTYDLAKESYVSYEYIKDGSYQGNPCYYYSKKLSKTVDGEYKHDSYHAVYKDGSKIVSNIDLP